MPEIFQENITYAAWKIYALHMPEFYLSWKIYEAMSYLMSNITFKKRRNYVYI